MASLFSCTPSVVRERRCWMVSRLFDREMHWFRKEDLPARVQRRGGNKQLVMPMRYTCLNTLPLM